MRFGFLRRPLYRVRARLGRRGCLLLTLGLTYILIGYGELVMPTTLIPDAVHLKIPHEIRATLWALSGLIAIFFAWRHRDKIGWIALYVMPFIRIVGYLGSYLAYLIARIFGYGPDGSPLAWLAVIFNLPTLFVVLIASGWRDDHSWTHYNGRPR
jgi:hypothetical protein